jgi:glycosyltransferase involved in cell wall biosynthesis
VLSIVAIGRNEAENIARLADSIAQLRSFCKFPVETIFIDSASDDDSVRIARERFDVVHELLDDPDNCASAGRYIGTIEAKYPWIFYIDGDMEICSDFFPLISGLPDAPEDWIGIIGVYAHRFDDGTTATQSFEGGVIKSEWAASYGGAVVLRRDAVLRAGNWSPGVYGKEEMELYARLGDGKRVVRYFAVPMIYHYSEAYSSMELLLRLLSPSGGQGKVFFGYGQSIHSLWRAGKLGAIVRLDVEPYLFWLLAMLGMVVAFMLPIKWALLFIIAELIVLSLWMRPGPVIRYLALPLSLFSGWGRYLPFFRPAVRRWSSSQDKAA